MGRCTACDREIPVDSRMCPYCGDPVVDAAGAPTITEPPKPAAPMAPSWSADSSSSDSIDEARFTPGTMLIGRYRIVGLLGKGGMGEVYRADDLTLRQPVALKFLPETLADNPRRLERFRHEVRIARQVSHPNVCRVYDIGEANGHPFLSMEYVDGEDLAAVLRRMGRPSKEKALQIARQLCAGLASAHEKGVLHRDLKPHNVMIDGQGRVRITDFGLAGFAGQFTGGEIRAGTPAYMSPEQLAGREVSVKSDIYSLGLVLFELFTGRRAFEGTSREQLTHSRTGTTPSAPSSLVEDIDPAVERVILRCLESEPSARPSSALAVAAALPGGDPLAAALEAGETPSPEVVAAAGDVGGMRPAIAILCLVGIVVGVVAVLLLRNPLYNYVPLEKPPQVLADRAREIIKQLGHTNPVHDTAYGFDADIDYLRFVRENDPSPDRWDKLKSARPPAIYFWYRQSPRALIPPASYDRVSLDQPPLTVSGMANVVLDPLGRLVQLNIDPPQREDASDDVVKEPISADWSLLFEAAQLDRDGFTPTEPKWTPPTFCDERAAWEGHYPNQPDVPIRIEAGGYRGKPIFFKTIGPWTRADRMEEWQRPGSTVMNIFALSILSAVVIASILIARRNLQLRRSDRSGANRLALAFFGVTLVGWMLVITHVSAPWEEFQRLVTQAGLALILSATLWLLYVALEPYVRRRWPQVLISWSRLLAGRFRDPLIGRDILVGGLFSVALVLTHQLSRLVLSWLDSPPPQPDWFRMHTLLGGRYLMGNLLSTNFIWFPLFFLFLLFVLRVLLRKPFLAVVAMLLLLSVPDAVFDEGPERLVTFAHYVLQTALMLMALIRFGLFAFAAFYFFTDLFFKLPMTLDLSAWYADSSLMALLLLAAAIGYGFHTALAGRPLFRDELFEA